jgi:hypothetical protein
MIAKTTLHYLPLLILGLAAAIIAIALSDGLTKTLYWDGDYAIFLIDMFHASQLDQQIGLSSRFGWAHPGPINYYLLLPIFLLSKGGEQSLMLGTLLCNMFFVLSATYIINKIANRHLAVAFSVILVSYVTLAMGPVVFFNVLLPFSTILPWALALCLSCAVALKGLKYLPLLGLALTYVAQMHVAFWLPSATLAFSSVALSLAYQRPTRRELLLSAGGFLLCLALWIPPLIEFNNLHRILGFFASRSGSEHSIRESLMALATLIAEPLTGKRLCYTGSNIGDLDFLLGSFLLVAAVFNTYLGHLKRNRFATALGCLILVQVLTYIFALTKVVGPILCHSITFFPVIAVFILLQFASVLSSYSNRFLILTSPASALGALALVAFSAGGMREAVSNAKKPDDVVASLYRELSNDMDKCGHAPCISIEHGVWPSAVGAISAAYRSGKRFSIDPPFWSIIFGWRVPTELSDYQISFISQKGSPVILLEDYSNSAEFTVKQVFRLEKLGLSEFGVAQFDKHTHCVRSDSFTDAGFVSGELSLPAGLYKLQAVIDWDVTAENSLTNGAHLSLHGERLLIPIKNSRGQDQHVSSYFRTDGGRFRVSFGLGGWSKGKGFVKVRELEMSSIRRKEQGKRDSHQI